MPAWEFEADNSGVVVNGRTARITGAITEAGAALPGRDAHTFSFDILQLQTSMYEEEMTADEALETALSKLIRDLQRSSGFTAPDAPPPPTAIPGFGGRKTIGDPKAHRERTPAP